jgi:hypothetical protein
MPIVGAAGAAVAIALASQRTGLDRKWVALGGAGVGVVVASSTSGWLKQLATGVAAAGAVIAVVDYLRERAAAPSQAPTRDATQDSKPLPSVPAPSSEAVPARAAPTAPENAAAPADDLTPEQLAHLQAIMEHLEPVEREQVAKLEKNAPADLIRSLKKTLVGLSVDDGVAFVRKNVLTKARQGRNGAHAPFVRS